MNDIVKDAVDDTKLVDDLATGTPIVDAEGKPVLDDAGKPTFEKVVDKDDVNDPDKKADLGLLSDDGDGDDDGVPDQYTFEPPDGVDITDEVQAGLDRFTEQATEMKLTQSQYQALVEYDLSRTQEAEGSAVDVWNTRVDGWREASRADKEIGGADFDKNAAIAEATIRQFGDKELLSLFRSPSEKNPDGLALINNPAILRAFTRIGAALGDPTLLEGDTKVETEGSLQRMYPSMFKETA